MRVESELGGWWLSVGCHVLVSVLSVGEKRAWWLVVVSGLSCTCQYVVSMAFVTETTLTRAGTR